MHFERSTTTLHAKPYYNIAHRTEQNIQKNMEITKYKCSAVAEMSDRLATMDMAEN